MIPDERTVSTMAACGDSQCGTQLRSKPPAAAGPPAVRPVRSRAPSSLARCAGISPCLATFRRRSVVPIIGDKLR